MKGNQAYLQGTGYNKRIDKALNLFWAGFIIYTTCYTLMISGVVTPKIIYLQLAGVVLFMIPTIHLVRFKIENIYLRGIYIIYFAWLLYVVSRGFKFDKEYLLESLTNGTGGIFLYLVPLILLFPKDLIYLKKIIGVIIILSVIYFLCDIAFIKSLLANESVDGQTLIEYFSKTLGIPCGFILLTIAYNTDTKKTKALWGKLWVLFIIVLTFFLAIIRARRGLMFMAINILFCAYLIYNYAFKSNLFIRFFPILIVFFFSVYAINAFNEKKKGMFSLMTEHIKEDTRSNVEEYFYLDMDKNEWMVGKGIDGMYWCPTGATADGWRGVIETDYLQIMLKGGIISFGLLFLIAVPAVYKGMFYSKNILSKAAATWIILWMIDLFPATVTTFSLNYLLVWISIGICYSKKIRTMPEELVKKQFQYKLF